MAIVERRTRRRTIVRLAAICLIIAVLVVAVVLAHRGTTPTQVRPSAPAPQSRTATSSQWDTVAEHALAARPMLVLPPQAAQPQALTTRSAGPSIALPRPTDPSPSGALSQLRASDQDAVAGGDPDVYDRAYRALSLRGAPDPRATGLYSVLVNFRAAGGLPDTGPVPTLSVNYEVAEGLVKGTTDSGHYTVVCVLGDLTVQYQETTVSAGVGDCQAMRWSGTGWRISPGLLAASAPCAWPGSLDAVDAGYRELV
jgi:hypothetical protein